MKTTLLIRSVGSRSHKIVLLLLYTLAIDIMYMYPKEVSSMVEDKEGFEYPQIEESKCVRCNQCLKVCPIKTAKSVLGERRYEY